ncbi:MAG: FtsX-like permease family protein [Bifidobacteriaceae bacterium]|nr:FtsX-like permease family protein [Bifidobacteriaceae bacterium]
MRRIATRSVRAHWGRLALSVLAVFLGVAFMTGTLQLRAQLGGLFDKIVDTTTDGKAYVQGKVPQQDTDANGAGQTEYLQSAEQLLDPSLKDVIESADGVVAACPDMGASWVLIGVDGTPVAQSGAPSYAISWCPDYPYQEDNWIAGTRPRGAGQIGLEDATATNAGYQVGDTAKMLTDLGMLEVTVTGIIDMEASMLGASIVLVDPAWMNELFGLEAVGLFAVAGEDGYSEEDLVKSINAVLPADSNAEAITGSEIREESKDSVASTLGFINTFLLIFAAIALFVGTFIIANTFAMTVRERMGEYALLRALGASPRQVFGLVTTQAVIVGAIGALLGLGGGIGLMELIRWTMNRSGNPLTGSMVPTVGTAATAIVVGILVTVVGAALPARRAATVAPVEVMREHEGANTKSLRLRTLIGLVVLAAGVGLAVAGCWDTKHPHALWVGCGAAAIVLGALIVAPALVSGAAWLLSWPFRVLRPMGRLARNNVARNPRRSATTGSALMIGVALVSAASVFATTMERSIANLVDQVLTTDIAVMDVATGGLVTPDVVQAIEDLPESGQTDGLYLVGGAEVEVDGETQRADLIGLAPRAFGIQFKSDVEAGSWEDCFDGDKWAVPLNIASKYGWKLGDTVTATTLFGSMTAQIGVIYPIQFAGETLGTIPERLVGLMQREEDLVPAFLMVKAADGVTVDQLKAAAKTALAPFMVFSAMDMDDFTKQSADEINTMLNWLYALLALSVIIAVLGIINTLALSLIERTREIGLLRAVGLGRGQLRVTVIIESVLTALFGTLTGVVVGTGLAATLPRLLADQGLSLLAIPWGTLATMLGLAVVVGVAAALWPAGRAAKMPVLDAIRAA